MLTVSSIQCPKCGAEEMHPDGKRLLIRGYKVYSGGAWRSQCLVCAGYYDENLQTKPIGKDGVNPDYDKTLGWF